MAENDAAKQESRSRLAGVVISNATVILSAIGASFAFSGFTYYQELFAAFGLKPFAIELSNVDIAAHGAFAVAWAIWTLIKAYWLRSVLTLGVALAIGGGIAFGVTRLPWLKAALEQTKPYLDPVSRANNRVLRWAIAFLILGVGFTAGGTAAKQDIAFFQQARHRPVNCYAIKGRVFQGIPLAQDKDTIILVRPRSTVVLSFDTMEIAVCRLQA